MDRTKAGLEWSLFFILFAPLVVKRINASLQLYYGKLDDQIEENSVFLIHSRSHRVYMNNGQS